MFPAGQMPSLTRGFVVALAAVLMAAPANAQIANSADVNGLHTFQDLHTGRVWLDLNNFYGMSTREMLAIATPAGFTFANTADVNQLLLDAPDAPANFAFYASVMGSAPARSILWGAYDNGFGHQYVAEVFATPGINWNSCPTCTTYDEVSFGNSDPDRDMNIFAYQTTTTPEPGSITLLATGLLGIGAVARRRRA